MVKVPTVRVATTSIARPDGYARGGRPLDISPITDEVRAFADKMKLERKNGDALELNKRLLAETSELQADYLRREQEAPLGAPEFAQNLKTDYEKRHSMLLERAWQEGYDEDAIREHDARLTGLRGNFQEKALVYQANSLSALGDKSFGEIETHLTQYVATTPDGYTAAKDELIYNADIVPGWDAVKRDKVKTTSLARLRQTAGTALVNLNPRYVIAVLDPKGFTADPRLLTEKNLVPGTPATMSGGVGYNPETIKAKIRVPEGTAGAGGDNKTNAMGSSASGRYQFTKDTFIDRYNEVYGSGGAAAWANNRFDVTTQERLMDRNLEVNKSILEAANIPVTDGTMYVMHVLGVGNGPKLLKADGTHPVSMYLSADIIEKNPTYFGGGKTVAESLQIIQGKVGDPIVVTPGTPSSVTYKVPAAPETPAGADGVDEKLQENPNAPPVRNTGNAILDDMTGQEQWDLVSQAREVDNRRVAAEKAAMDHNIAAAQAQAQAAMGVNIGNAVSEFIQTGAGREITKEAVVAAYGPGPEAEQKWAEYERAKLMGPTIFRIRSLPPEQIAKEINKLRPVLGSPTYEVDLKFYDAAVKAQQDVLSFRDKDPTAALFAAHPEITQKLSNAKTPAERKAAYTLMDRAYDQMGIPEHKRSYATADMLEGMKKQYATATPRQKLGIIEQYMAEMPNARAAGVSLVHVGGKGMPADIALYATLVGNPGYQDTFMRVMEGRHRIEVDPASKPSPEVINKAFAGQLGPTINSISAENSALFNEAAAAYYVEAGGRTENGELTDPKLYTQALMKVMGTEGIVDLNGGAVKELTILPQGINLQQFQNWKDNLQAGDLSALSLTPGAVPTDASGRHIPLDVLQEEGVFVMRTPGVYGIKLMSDGRWVGDGRGGAFRIKITPEAVNRRPSTVPDWRTRLQRGHGS